MKITFKMAKWQSKKIKDALDEEGMNVLDKEGKREGFALLAQPLLSKEILVVRSLTQKQYNEIYKTIEKVFCD